MVSPRENQHRLVEPSKLRRQITHHAAKLLYERQESEYYQAKMKAARRCFRGWVKPDDLPSNGEIRDEVLSLSRMFEGDARLDHLQAMRLEALRMMRIMANFGPRLIGSVLTGHVRHGSDIDIHLFSDSLSAVTGTLEQDQIRYDVDRKQVRKQGETKVYTHIHVPDRYPIELTLYPANQAHVLQKSSITGKSIERVSIRELEQFLTETYPGIDLDQETLEAESKLDRFLFFEMLLLPLENVKQNPKYHPEGDALYHSLQVYQLAFDALPYDEEFLLAALLHDVGKAIDPQDHVQAGLEALADMITPRTHWLIEHHMLGHAMVEGTLGARALRRLKENESFEEL
ncbi:MAG: HD domain-containing protein, partial [Pirellulaceae bacterium]